MNNDAHNKAYTFLRLRERLRDADNFNYQDACRGADAIEELEDKAGRYWRAVEFLFEDGSGDLDYIKWYINEKILSIEDRTAGPASDSPQGAVQK